MSSLLYLLEAHIGTEIYGFELLRLLINLLLKFPIPVLNIQYQVTKFTVIWSRSRNLDREL